MQEDIQFLKELQHDLIRQETDYQAEPRFWVIKDYRMVPGNDDYDDGDIQYFYNDGDYIVFQNFEELKSFLEVHFSDEIEVDEILKELLYEFNNFEELWNYVYEHLNDDRFFDTIFVKEEGYIVPNTMFLTKEEAKIHLKSNYYHYSSKAHTYAMTAWRSPQVERLLKILETFDWDKHIKKDNGIDLNVEELKMILQLFEQEMNSLGLTTEENALMNKLETRYKELGGYVK